MKVNFCNAKLQSNVTGLFVEECTADYLSFIPHGLLILITVAIIVYKWSKVRNTYSDTDKNSWVRFPGHSLRWILTLISAYCYLLELSEGVVADLMSTDIHLHLYLPPIVAFGAAVASLSLYTFSENHNVPSLMMVSLVYWSASAIAKVVKVMALMQAGLGGIHVRYVLAWLVLAFYLALVLLELYILLKAQRYIFKDKKRSIPAEELSRIKYVHPYTNFLSHLTWYWLKPFLEKGYKEALEMEDLGQMPETESSNKNFLRFKQIFNEEKTKAALKEKQPSLWWCYWRAYWPLLVVAGVYKVSADMLIFVGPMCLDKMVEYIAEEVENGRKNVTLPMGSQYTTVSQYFSNGYVLVVITLGATLLQGTFWQNHFFLCIRQGIRLKGAIQGMVFDKTLKLSSWTMSEGGMTPGQILNHMTVDPLYLTMFVYLGHFVWSLPLQVFVTFVLLYAQLGISAIISAVFIVLMCPVQYFIGRKLAHVQKEILEQADERLKKCNELLQCMKLVKLYAWEMMFCKSIEVTRGKELRLLIKAALFRCWSISVVTVAPITASLFVQFYSHLSWGFCPQMTNVLFSQTFSAYPYLENEPLRAGKVFSCIALFSLLTLPLYAVTFIISIVSHAMVSTKRLLPFFLAPETFSVYPYVEEEPLRAGKVFSCLALFNILGLPLYVVTLIINIVSHARVSTKRLKTFFLAPEIGTSSERKAQSLAPPDASGVPGVAFENQPNGTKNATFHNSSNDKVEESLEHAEMSRLLPDNSMSLLGGDSGVDVQSPDSASREVTMQRELSNLFNMNLDELPWIDGEEFSPEADSSPSAVEIDKGCFSWDLEGKDLILKDIKLKIPTGKLTLVVGKVGSGKSSLISAMLGEMTQVSGNLHWKKNVKLAYGAQKAWLMNATLKENILFGKELDEARYARVINCCALAQDLAILPAGDQTEIGEKGINLSGGQKQRISIARALYSMADVVLLDDPMSALDVHVGSHIFKEAVVRFLLKQKKTVLLVTHQLQYLPFAHKVIVMCNGRITHQGNLKEIRQQDPELYETWKSTIEQAKEEMKAAEKPNSAESDASLIATPKKDHLFVPKTSTPAPKGSLTGPLHKKTRSTKSIETLDFDKSELPYMAGGGGIAANPGIRSALSMLSLSHLGLYDSDEEEDSWSLGHGISRINKPKKPGAEERDDTGRLIEEEERAKGSVTWRVYFEYFKAGTVVLFTSAMVAYVLRQVLRMGTDFWLADWAEAARVAEEAVLNSNGSVNATMVTNENLEAQGYDLGHYIRGYAYLCVTGMVVGVICIGLLEWTALTAARNLHKKMLHCIIEAPMRFFDTTPIGRIVNRLANDTNTIDEKLPVSLDGVFYAVLYVIGGIVINTVSTPIFIIPAIPMLVLYIGIQRYFIASSREMQRLDNISRSPILSHFSETLGGLATIRAYRDQKRFQIKNWEAVDDNNSAFLYLHTANVWMGIRLDYLGALIVFVAAVCSLTSALYGFINPSFAGLAIAYAIMISGGLNWMMRDISEATMWFNCVERVLHYTKIVPELYNKPNELTPPADWPKLGEVKFENVSLRYDSTLDPVIHNLNLHIRAGEKLGICGRTGSGKSSLTLGLFRIMDQCGGRICIDGVDISQVPLRLLRSRLCIIPQDPLLFAGTIRHNLDPEDICTDEEIWKALDTAQLKSMISSFSEQLETLVTDGGENFSVGQRQLFCLARAFLRKSRVLIMDEATASIDMETDALIQKVIKTSFKDRTIITIAHRVVTIAHCDQILVLQEGRIQEQDAPKKLLARDSIFAQMVRENK